MKYPALKLFLISSAPCKNVRAAVGCNTLKSTDLETPACAFCLMIMFSDNVNAPVFER